jgi:hypothetical protein
MVAVCRDAGYGFSIVIIRKASPLKGWNRIPMEKKNALASVCVEWQESAQCMQLATLNPLALGYATAHGYFVF